MNTDAIETPLSYMQLMTKFRESYAKTKEALIKLRSTVNPFQKVERIRELLEAPVFAGAAIKKIEAKSVLEVKYIADSISKQVNAAPFYDERQIGMWVGPAYDKLIDTLDEAREHAHSDILKANALVRIIRGTRSEIESQRKKAIKIARRKIEESKRRQAANQNSLSQHRRAA